MSDTPRTDAAWDAYLMSEGYSEDAVILKRGMKQLERELADARKQRDMLAEALSLPCTGRTRAIPSSARLQDLP